MLAVVLYRLLSASAGVVTEKRRCEARPAPPRPAAPLGRRPGPPGAGRARGGPAPAAERLGGRRHRDAPTTRPNPLNPGPPHPSADAPARLAPVAPAVVLYRLLSASAGVVAEKRR
ncbi:hypothetical protein ABZT17_11315 [Streptomyces sp. NPDC005648]|uniref:hypothetical protein n=1 Tax=Streptomyces sp. NPDC005648 TaxID=3157044 RepID=UPI0033B008C4